MNAVMVKPDFRPFVPAAEPAAVAGGAAACVAAALLQRPGAIVLPGAGHSATSGPPLSTPPTGAGSVAP